MFQQKTIHYTKKQGDLKLSKTTDANSLMTEMSEFLIKILKQQLKKCFSEQLHTPLKQRKKYDLNQARGDIKETQMKILEEKNAINK